jgi:hypothetical protein
MPARCRLRQVWARGQQIRKYDLSELMFVGVADDARNSGQSGDFFGRALGITSRDDNLGQRILPLHAADGGARILIGGIRNRARI